MVKSFVPGDFAVPQRLVGPGFRLEPLGSQHNEPDNSAWTSSIDHIRHADDFEHRRGFTYTVLDDADRIIGCVYIYPSRSDTGVAKVQSWVTADRAELDGPLHDAVSQWLATEWPFPDVRYRPTN